MLLHAEIDAAVPDKFVELLEAPFVEKKMDALASSEFAGFVFALAPFRTATSFGFPGNAAKLFHAVAMPDFRDQTSLGLRQRFLPRKGIFFV